MHYYQFNIGDYIKHTLHLSAEEDICYRRLLDLYYDTEQPIPTDIPSVSRRIRMGFEVVESVLREFFDLTDEGYKNHRCDAEIEAYHAYIDKQRANGKRGGRPKKTQRKPTANPSQSQTKAKKSLNINHEPETINQPINRTASLQKPVDVEPDVWISFLAVRKQKRAAVSEVAILGIRREAVKAGISMNHALTICCERGWASFKSDWDWQGQGQQPRKTQHQINQEGIARSLGLIPRNSPPAGGTIIEGEAHETTARLVDR